MPAEQNNTAPLPRSPHRSPRAANCAAALFAATTRRLSGAVTLVCVCERCLTCFYDIWGRTGSIVAHAAPRTAVPSRRPPNGEPRVSAAAPVRPCHATVGPWRLRRGFLGLGRSEYTTSRCWVPSQPLARLRGRREAAETQFAAYSQTDGALRSWPSAVRRQTRCRLAVVPPLLRPPPPRVAQPPTGRLRVP